MERMRLLFRKKSIKIVAVLCTMAIIIGLVPVFMSIRSSSAATWDGSTTTKPAGSGNESNPYLIANGANLAWMAQNVSSISGSNKYFKQTADIDLGSKAWTPIGKEESGINSIKYDGGGHSINNLYINSASYRFAGLFGILCGSVVKNLTISGSMKNTYPSGGSYTGAIAGILDSNSIVIGCSNLSSVASNATDSWSCAGGMIGENRGKIISCKNSGSINASCTSSTSIAGGMTGNNTGEGSIISCYNVGTVVAEKSRFTVQGGILGQNDGGNIGSCYYTKGGTGGGGTSTTTAKLKNSDGKNTVINAMNDKLKTYYNANSDVTEHFYWTYDGSTDEYPIAEKKTPTISDINVSGIPEGKNKVYDEKTVVVTASAKSSGLGTITVKYNNSSTPPSTAGKYTVTADIADGVDYYASTITLGSFEISKATPQLDNLIVNNLSDKVYDGEPVEAVTVAVKDSVIGMGAVGEIKYDGSTTAPSLAGTYAVTVDLAEGVNYTAETVSLGEITINKATLSSSDIDPGTLQDFVYSLKLKSKTPEANSYGSYAWENPDAVANEIGSSDYKLIFTPKDTSNYNYTNIDGWAWDDSSKTLSKTFTVETVFLKNRQIIAYFNKNVMG